MSQPKGSYNILETSLESWGFGNVAFIWIKVIFETKRYVYSRGPNKHTGWKFCQKQ